MSAAPFARLAELNPPQREAVVTTEGPLLVLAGAGSGKTRVITYRVAHLLELGVPAERILAVSFTNKAADEMHERVSRLVSRRAAKALTLCTFHALGLQILKAEEEALGYPGGFTIYDTADQLGVIREILRHAHIQDKRLDHKAILSRISRLKNAGVSPERFIEGLRKARHVSEYDSYAAEVFPRYRDRMRAFCALDFDDLLVETLRILTEDEAVRRRWQERFRYLMIDEYQDTNQCQLALLRLLCATHRNLAVVGDDDQSIYSWRGAEPRNILDFAEQFPGAKVVKLEENYRSTQVILGAANAVIQKNGARHEKTLWTSKAGGEPIQLVVAPDAESEARFVAEEIDVLRSRHRFALSDIAILYRSNVQAHLLEEELRQAQIEYRMIGGQALFDRKEIKDAIAYLQLLFYQRDEIALRRVINYPARGIGDTTMQRLGLRQKQAGKDVPLFDVLLSVCREEAQHGAHGRPLKGDVLPGLAGPAPAPPPEGEEALGPRVRAAIAGFVDSIQRHRTAMLAGPGWQAAATAYLKEMGIMDDLIRAGPTPLAAQRRLRNLESFLESLGRFEARGTGPEGLRAYLHRLTLSSKDDDADELQGEAVTLSTLHGAKGLEFKIVFFVGLEEGLLPHRRTLESRELDETQAGGADAAGGGGTDISEERRLCYVGITRARERLYMSRAELRGSRAFEAPRTPSRFLDDVPKELVAARDLSVPGGGLSAEDEEEFARQQLLKMLKMTE